ncbi:hypothetical protein [Janthinobacterium fluminis]|uniref:Lipoprotein n=1 Tax=Janthinobacterium fluminis TaxID=2987524 RepID=A0ABT5JX50_9BURK|nr:hypothetical protein [Janthinobacterium fluminis]MDC8757056.1 hypothetical protein [Janthinobacterium fluminis]
MRLRTLPLCLCLPLLAGCAGVEVQSIPDAAADAAATGLRYYDTSPFLLVYTDAKGGLRSELLYLADTSKKRAIRPYSYAAANDATLRFDHGRLLEAKAVVSEAAIPLGVLAALEKVAVAGSKGANAADQIPAPYLFRIVKKNGSWKLSGGQALDLNGQPALIRYLPK